jgi:hypothetical protein
MNIVTYRPTARQLPQHTRGQQYRNDVFCGPLGERYLGTRNAHGQQYRQTVFSALRCPCRDCVREYENGKSIQVSVEDSHGKLVDEELEVDLWRLSVWLEDSITVRLF